MKRGARIAAALAVAVALCAGGTASPAQAQSQTEARRQTLLQDMLHNPGNLEVAYEYAALSTQVGDYEAAVSTFERMLIFTPNSPRLQLELGILYYRLGSYEVARTYFAQVLASPGVSPEIAAQVRLYLQQLALEAEPPPFSATIFSGIRWESNANAGPASQSVTLNGLDFTLDDTSVAAPDWSAVNIGTMHYGYNLNQGDRIEFDAITYNANYFDLTDINLNFIEATLGPSFNMKRWGMDKSRLFVYGIGDETLLGNDQYFAAAGGGIRVLSFAAARSVLDFRVETRMRWFNNTNERPINTFRDGAQTRAGGYYSYYLGPGLVLIIQAYGQREDAEVGYFANSEFGASAGIAWTFANPIALGRYPWTLQIGAGGIHRDYDDPDPVVNPNQSEVDKTFWSRASLIVPVNDTLAMVPQVEYRDQDSNYVISKFDDFSAMLGLQKRF